MKPRVSRDGQKVYMLYMLYKHYIALVADFDRPSALVLFGSKTKRKKVENL